MKIMSPRPGSSFLVLIGCALAMVLHGQEISLQWKPSGVFSKLRYYLPQKSELSPIKPEGVQKLPDGVTNAEFAKLRFGPVDKPMVVAAMIANDEKGEPKLWIDANGNGDFADDPDATWTTNHRKSGSATITSWSGNGSVMLKVGPQTLQLGLSLYRFGKDDPTRKGMNDTLFFYRDFGMSGTINAGGKTHEMVVVDDSARCDFSSENCRVCIDVNDNGRFEFEGEQFKFKTPFNLDGTTYEVVAANPETRIIEMIKSTRKVEDKPAAKTPTASKGAGGGLVAGDAAKPFEDTALDGKPVRFPDDYKGKLVILDFWATWCGPCIRELPNLKQVYEDFHAKGLEVLGVSLDSESTLPRLKDFIQDKGMTWRHVADGKSWQSRIGTLYGIHAIPAMLLVDGTTGKLVARDLRGDALGVAVKEALTKLGNDTPEKKPEPSKPSTSSQAPEPDTPLVAKARAITVSGKQLDQAAFLRALEQPQPSFIKLVVPGTQPLRGRDIARHAQAGYVRAGWLYRCTKCSHWHTTLAGGYAISEDAVVTCHHVLDKPDNMQAGQGFPVIVRGEDELLPIKQVLADDSILDAVVVRVGVSDLHPLSLQSEPQVGDNVFCLSDPRGVRGYFSEGIVNRFFVRDQGDPSKTWDQRIHVSTDWAPGSSGSAVLDEHGNVVGHVARIRALFADKPQDPEHNPTGTLMSLHEAIPAKSVLELVRPLLAEKP